MAPIALMAPITPANSQSMADTLYIMTSLMPHSSLCVAPNRAIIMRQPWLDTP